MMSQRHWRALAGLLAGMAAFTAVWLAHPRGLATEAGVAPVFDPAPTVTAIAAITPITVAGDPAVPARASRVRGIPDPFVGGPPVIWKDEGLPRPEPETPVYAIPAVRMNDPLHVDRRRTVDLRPRNLPAPPGRYAGWVAAADGIVEALVVTPTGTYATRVGQVVDGCTVLTITPTQLTLCDPDGHVVVLPLAWE
jgi:hypothetical protein